MDLIAGIAFDPHIRGALTVLVAVVILPGSIYMILGTNLGNRLGFQVALGGLFAWMFILGLTWWFWPPAIGPRGEPPSWRAVDVVRGDPAHSAEAVAHDLPYTCWSSTADGCITPADSVTIAAAILTENRQRFDEAGLADLAEDAERTDEQAVLIAVADLDDDATLSEIASVDAGMYTGRLGDFGDWHLVASSDAGEAQAAADAELKELEVFENAADYFLLDAFEQGGKEQLPADPSRWDRIWNKVATAAQLRHPTHYALVQVQEVVHQEVAPGEAPPPPVADPDQPVVTVVMVRDLGTLRVPGFLVTVASGLMLGVIAYSLHRRDLLADEHRAGAAAE